MIYFTAAQKTCKAGRYRTRDNICKDCPSKTWSKDAATICCPDGQYEASCALCENCPAGTYLTWCKESSSKENKCQSCGKGKVREIKPKSHYLDNLSLTIEERFLRVFVTWPNQHEVYLSSSLVVPIHHFVRFTVSFIHFLQVSQAGSAVCTTCTAGKYADHNTNNCVPCPANTYSKAQMDVCTPCPLNTYSALGDAKCRKCGKGYKLNAERTGCQLVNPVCTPSPPPTTPPTILPTTPSRPLGKTLSFQRNRGVARN